MKAGLAVLALLFSVQVLAQNITDLAVMGDRTAATSDLDDVTIGPAIEDSVFLHPDRIRYDARCFQIEGEDVFLLSGTFHYFRTPQPLWRDRMEKIKAMGFNCVETYVPWNWHEREMPASPDDFSKVDLRELDDFLTLAEDVGLYAIVRPGPYICAEWSGGGFPQWIMQKRPAKTLHDVWLQSMDSTFLAWNDHWYRAVCRVVESHQLTRKPKGAYGVVLMQVENEFNRIKWFPRAEKRAYLEHMAQQLRKGGIDVPLISCWTDEARNVASGPLNGVVDMVNSYPRWNIRKGFGRLINQQLKSQPGKPLISGELQGGWSSDLGTPLSWDMDGMAPVQTQNITLYALQRGFCALNYYMLVGGTNFDDWAARNQTATYDFAAAIGEDGTLNERYYRLQALAEFIREHGTRIARSRIEEMHYQTTDTLVELLMRRALDGTRYLFVRTEEHSRHHKGQLSIDKGQLTIDFDLEPFGSKVYVMNEKGEIENVFPREVKHTGAPAPKRVIATLTPQLLQPESPSRIHFSSLMSKKGKAHRAFPLHRHPILYNVRAKAKGGGTLTISRVGKNQMNHTEADVVLAFADERPLSIIGETDSTISFSVPRGTRSLLFLYDSRGLHHHTNLAVERTWNIVPASVTFNGAEQPFDYYPAENEIAMPFVNTYSASFTLRASHLRLLHTGNGFVYLNGYCLGRCYESGPQTDYYLPECWLNADKPNMITVTLLPSGKRAEIQEMSLLNYDDNHQQTTPMPVGRWGDQGDGTFRNPILRADYSDPDPLRVGDDFYLVSSTFEDFPALTILHSRDLVNWQTIGAAFTHLDQVSDDYTWRRMNRYNGGVYAPTITYHNGRFYIYANLYTDGFYMAWADRPEGPWHEQMLRDRKGRLLKIPRWSDPCPLFDDDGKAYLMTSHPRRTHWYSYLFQMSPDGTQLLDADSAALAANTDFYEWPGGGTVVSPYHSSEGNRIFKHEGYYYLQHIEFTSLGQGEGTYIARSRNIYGTHTDGTPGSPGNPGNYEMQTIEHVTSRDSMRLPGQGGYVTTPDGRWWWIGQFTHDYPEGRTPWLVPVTWKDGWPIMDSTPIQMEKPIQGYESQLPQGSNDFNKPTLDTRWRWNHTPRNDYWSLTERPGWMRLKAFRPAKRGGFFGAGNTLMQHAMPSDSTVITTRLDVSCMAYGQYAGLAVFNGGKSYALIGVKDRRLYFDTDGTVTDGPILKKGQKSIFLRAYINKEGQARFAYSVKGHCFQYLGATYQMVAGNFRGARVGLFSYNTDAEEGFADFDYFDYQINNR